MKNMVFMYNIYNKLLPANIMSYLKTINACHNHNVRIKKCNFKIKFSRTTKKSECISVKGPKMWNDIPADIYILKNAQSFTFATLSIWLIAFVLLVCNDYLKYVMY